MILRLLRGGSAAEIIVGLFSSIFVVFCTLPIHEFAHAITADKLGDPTPRRQGRLTLNPLAHLDIWGCLMILLVGYGYAKPVPVSMHNFKNPKSGMALVAFAGPLSNILMAFVFVVLYRVFGLYLADHSVFSMFFYYAASINVMLAVFNLLPIPPLDGSRIAFALIPNKYYYTIMQYERYIMIGLFVLMLTGALTYPLNALSGALMRGLNTVAQLIVRSPA